MPEIGVDYGVLLGRNRVKDGKLSGRRTDIVKEREPHKYPGRDPWGQMVNVDVAQLGEDFLFSLVNRIEQAHVVSELNVCVFGEIHIPNPLVIRKEWID